MLVPSLVLQPIVENAIKHGISQRANGGRIDLRAWQDSGHLNMQVCNDGPALADDWHTRGNAIGLGNVRNRLQALYGVNASLEIANTSDARVCVTLRVPLRAAA
jgi:LytS/YehU family sensor histidine kinase